MLAWGTASRLFKLSNLNYKSTQFYKTGNVLVKNYAFMNIFTHVRQKGNSFHHSSDKIPIQYYCFERFCRAWIYDLQDLVDHSNIKIFETLIIPARCQCSFSQYYSIPNTNPFIVHVPCTTKWSRYHSFCLFHTWSARHLVTILYRQFSDRMNGKSHGTLFICLPLLVVLNQILQYQGFVLSPHSITNFISDCSKRHQRCIRMWNCRPLDSISQISPLCWKRWVHINLAFTSTPRLTSLRNRNTPESFQQPFVFIMHWREVEDKLQKPLQPASILEPVQQWIVSLQ